MLHAPSVQQSPRGLKLKDKSADRAVVGTVTVSASYFREKALRSLSKLPPFSPILHKLLATLADEDVSFARLAELIEKDTVLAGNVLRLVNSALYGRRGTVSSVRHAVSLMGVVKLRNAAMSFSVSNMWNHAKTPPGWSAKRFNLHATATAIMSDLLAQKVPVTYPEGAFAGGLLHDIGLLLIAIGLPEQYKDIEMRYLKDGLPLAECETLVIGLDHGDLSAAVLAEWNLPEPIQQAVRALHKPPRSRGPEWPLSTILDVAERVIDLKGITVLQGGKPPDDSVESLFAAIGLKLTADAMFEEFNAEFEPIKAFF